MSTFSGSIPLRFMGAPAGHVNIKNGMVDSIQFSTYNDAEDIRKYLDECEVQNITLIERMNYNLSLPRGITFINEHFEITQLVQEPVFPLNPRPPQRDGLKAELEMALTEIQRAIDRVHRDCPKDPGVFTVSPYEMRYSNGQYILAPLLIQKAQLIREIDEIVKAEAIFETNKRIFEETSQQLTSFRRS